ncbi:hypothetical protein NDU88_000922 [Pleurodeles waltl]|uniref:Uncharacterized protein n=1 Tax=Pleurodeles waltl TaxID=8319 RepID=A0AAV7VUY2_PLEWA|nr:hypothetical protein NDU88_000922 [Pleurodeles waltl]
MGPAWAHTSECSHEPNPRPPAESAASARVPSQGAWSLHNAAHIKPGLQGTQGRGSAVDRRPLLLTQPPQEGSGAPRIHSKASPATHSAYSVSEAGFSAPV